MDEGLGSDGAPSGEDEGRLDAAATTIERAKDGTIRPPFEFDRTLRDMTARRAANRATLSQRLEIGAVIGEGGMGVVRVATQTILAREVAVKSPRAEVLSDGEFHRLMQEAWLTSALEHPNIVPIHDVMVDEDGRPHIVLKRVSGTTWDRLMADPHELQVRFGAKDALDWNLAVFLQVCNAIHFAHSCDIIHRDLKPENVMIGEFGEVYVLDWGIALSLVEDPSGRLPSLSEATRMAGTPGYMAPEMLGGSPPRLSTRTDVYLLGAILYEILRGRPPHVGETPMAVVSSIALSEPTMSTDGPDELQAIILRALAREPQDRFSSVDELRRAVRAFSSHRASAALARRAHAQLTTLFDSIDGGSDGDRQELYNLFGALQFGFRAALDSWAENEIAASGLRRATQAMVSFELRAGDPRAAQALIASIDAPSPDLLAQVEKALQEREARETETRALADAGRQMDQRTGAGTRLLWAVGVGLLWTVVPLVRLAVFGAGPVRVEEIVYVDLTIAGLSVVVFAFQWRTAFSTRFNQTIFGALVVLLAAQFGAALAAWLQGSATVSTSTLFTLSLVICAMTALAMEPALWLSTLAYAVAWGITLVWPHSSTVMMSISNAVLITNLVLIWRSGRRTSKSA